MPTIEEKTKSLISSSRSTRIEDNKTASIGTWESRQTWGEPSSRHPSDEYVSKYLTKFT